MHFEHRVKISWCNFFPKMDMNFSLKEKFFFRWLLESLHKGPVISKKPPCDDVIMTWPHFCQPGSAHDDVIKWKHFPRYWPFVRGIHRSPVNSPHKGQWRGALMFSLICTWINGWVNNRETGWFETPSPPLWRHCNVDLWINHQWGKALLATFSSHKQLLNLVTCHFIYITKFCNCFIKMVNIRMIFSLSMIKMIWFD